MMDLSTSNSECIIVKHIVMSQRLLKETLVCDRSLLIATHYRSGIRGSMALGGKFIHRPILKITGETKSIKKKEEQKWKLLFSLIIELATFP